MNPNIELDRKSYELYGCVKFDLVHRNQDKIGESVKVLTRSWSGKENCGGNITIGKKDSQK